MLYRRILLYNTLSSTGSAQRTALRWSILFVFHVCCHSYSHYVSWKTSLVVSCLENAKPLGNIQLGNSEQSITAQMYLSHEVWDDKTNDTLDATIHVLMDDCSPIFYGMEGKDPAGNDRIMTFLIGGFQDHVTNMTVFDKPSECP